MKHLPVPLEPCYTILPMLTLFNWLWKNQRNLQFIRLQWKSLAKDRKGYFLIGKIVKELEVLFQVTSLFRSEIRSNDCISYCSDLGYNVSLYKAIPFRCSIRGLSQMTSSPKCADISSVKKTADMRGVKKISQKCAEVIVVPLKRHQLSTLSPHQLTWFLI